MTLPTVDWLESRFISILIFFGVLLAFYIFKAIIIGRLRKLSDRTKNDVDDFVIDLLKTPRLVFGLTVALIAAIGASGANPFSFTGVTVLTIAVATYQVARSVGVVFDFSVRKASDGKRPAASVQGLKTIVDIVIWIVGGLTVMSALGFNITSIIAGLGIGGIAVALALQNLLGDIFSSFSIYFDKPFTVGDYIVVGDNEGAVERIGMKTTRIRSLRGEEIVMSNRMLTERTVQNFGRLERRRVLELLGLEYGTSNAKLEKLPAQLEKIVESQEKAEFERVYFKSFGDSALLYEFSYYVNSSDFEEFTETRHRINMDIKALFEKQGLSMAFPTQTVHLAKES